MARVALSSSLLEWVDYSVRDRVLKAGFTSGSVYAYSGVPKSVYEGLLAARSHGEYFIEHVRDSYSCVKMR
jgi:hypothetical protein